MKPGASVEALLEDLQNGGIMLMGLLKHLDDPRVRPALLSQLAARSPAELTPVVQVLGAAGGEGVCAALARRLGELMESDEVWDGDTEPNPVAVAACMIAQAWLTLSREAVPAADALAALTKHSCPRNQYKAAHALARVYEPLRTPAMLVVKEALEALHRAEDDMLFLQSIHGEHVPPSALQRCAEVFHSDDPEVRALAASVLVGSSLNFLNTADLKLDTWFSADRPLRERVTAALQFAALMDHELLASVAKEAVNADERPIQMMGLRIVERLPEELGEQVAKDAIEREDDAIH